MAKLRIATRGSALALWQANRVADSLRALDASLEVELRRVVTTADRHSERPLRELGDKGLFVKELEQALLDGEADIAVHSLKDVPGELPTGLILAAIPEREDPSDVLLTADGRTLAQLPAGSVVATSSPRRVGQVLHLRPDLKVTAVRGNVDTRIRKLLAGEFDALMLAAAGVHRLGLTEHVAQRFDVIEFVPAAGQGALAIEAAEGSTWLELVRAIDSAEASVCVSTERAFTKLIGADCDTPVACHCRPIDSGYRFSAVVCSVDGTQYFRTDATFSREGLVRASENAARELLAQGAGAVISPR